MNKSLFRKYWMSLLLGCLLIMILFGLPDDVASQAEKAHVYIEPADSSAFTCDTHDIYVMIEDVVDLTAYHLEISFDPDVVEVLEVVNGEFLAEPEDVDYFFEPTNAIDNVGGLITFGMAQQGIESNPEVEPQTGAGSLIVITLKALVPNGIANFNINGDESMMVDWPDAFEIEFTTTNGIVRTRNCPPEADPQTVTTKINTPVDITLTGSDPDDDPLLYFLVLPFPSNGTLSGGPLPNLTYTPNPGFTGTDTFTFRVFDGYDFSLPTTVTIIVTEEVPGPDDILLSNDTISEGEPSGTVVGVFSTVSDHPTATYSYTLVDGDGDDDNDSFEIVFNDVTGEYELRSKEVFDSNIKGEYTIRVRSTDNEDPTLFTEKIFIIRVLSVGFGYYLPLFYR